MKYYFSIFLKILELTKVKSKEFIFLCFSIVLVRVSEVASIASVVPFISIISESKKNFLFNTIDLSSFDNKILLIIFIFILGFVIILRQVFIHVSIYFKN